MQYCIPDLQNDVVSNAVILSCKDNLINNSPLGYLCGKTSGWVFFPPEFNAPHRVACVDY